MYLKNVCACVDTASFQYLGADSSRKAERSRKSVGEMSPAAHIIEALITESSRIVGMTGSHQIIWHFVLRCGGVGILQKRTEGSSRSAVVEDTRHDMGHGINGRSTAAGISSCHEACKLLGVNIFSRGKIVHGNAYGRTVSLTEHGDRYPIIPE